MSRLGNLNCETVELSLKRYEPTQIAKELKPWRLQRARIVDLAGEDVSYLIEADNGATVKLSSTAYALLRHLASGGSFSYLAERIKLASGQSVEPAVLCERYSSLIADLNHLYSLRQRRFSSAFWLGWTILPTHSVRAIAKFLAHAFSLIGVLVACFAAITCGVALHLSLREICTPAAATEAFILLLGCLLIHELGHASACARFKVDPKEIGFGLYLICPVFYADVTAAWRLRRYQRVIVDLGGYFFQLYAVGAISALYLLTGCSCFRIAIMLNLYSMVFTLSPIFKFDGYWILADCFGRTPLATATARDLDEATAPADFWTAETIVLFGEY